MTQNWYVAGTDENTTIGGEFLRLITSGQVTKIKLIGDSITVGAQGGGQADNARPLIGTTGIHEGNITSPVWANLFRNYINAKYPSIEFFNAGIGGWSASLEGLQNGTGWYGTDNDVVFVMLGTNDRADAASEAVFETNLQTFLSNVKANCNYMYVLTAPPSDDDFDSSGNKNAALNMTMEQIDKVISKVCVKNGWKHLSFYQKFMEYQRNTQIPFTTILNANDAHPIAAGYLLMWKMFQEELGLITNYYDWKTNVIDTAKQRVISEVASYTNVLNSSTPVSFPSNQVTTDYISTVHPDKANFPEGKAGNLVTVRGVNNSFIIQYYFIYQKGNSYVRYCTSDTTWSAWTSESSLNEIAGMLNASLLTSFSPNKISYTIISNASPDKPNLPEGAGGLLTTISPSSGYFAYQEYRIYTQNRVYKRNWTGSAWASWKRISGNMSLLTSERTALSTVGLSAGDEIFDTTLNKPVWRNAANNGWVDATGAVV